MKNQTLIVSMLTAVGISLFLSQTAFAATTWYVRMDGGTPAQCTGTTNAPYSGSGSNQPCALNHPVWALGAPGTTALMAGGDTLFIDDTNHATGGQAQYEIGYSMPNTVSWNCYINWTYNCVMSNVPSGPSAANPTRILGINYNTGCGTKPQLWGTDGLNQIFNLSGSSNVDMECMELTDHSNCGFRVGNPVCAENWNSGTLSGPYAKDGVYAQGGANFSFVNMDVHGFANRGFLMGGINGITMSYVNMDGNYMSNWDGDVGETGNVSYDTGNIVMDHVKNRFAGCSEAYPRRATFNTADYSNCTDQNGGGYGDGFGSYTTGGNWVITDSEFSHNTQDGLDLLYHDGTGSVTIQRSLFEGSVGNQVKITSPLTDIENSVIIGNCTYLADTNKVYNTSSFNSCRAGGDAVVMTPAQGGTYTIYNSSIYAGGNSDVLVTDRLDTCNGTETYTFRNNIYQGNGTSSLYIDSLSGACTTPELNTDYSIINDVSNNTCPSGSHNLCNTDPKWMEPVSLTADSNLTNVYLQSDSIAVGRGEVITGLSALDFNGTSRSSLWDMGAIQNVTPTAVPAANTSLSVSTSPLTSNSSTSSAATSDSTSSTSTVTASNTTSSTPISTNTSSNTNSTHSTTPTTTTSGSTWGTVVSSSFVYKPPAGVTTTLKSNVTTVPATTTSTSTSNTSTNTSSNTSTNASTNTSSTTSNTGSTPATTATSSWGMVVNTHFVYVPPSGIKITNGTVTVGKN